MYGVSVGFIIIVFWSVVEHGVLQNGSFKTKSEEKVNICNFHPKIRVIACRVSNCTAVVACTTTNMPRAIKCP